MTQVHHGSIPRAKQSDHVVSGDDTIGVHRWRTSDLVGHSAWSLPAAAGQRGRFVDRIRGMSSASFHATMIERALNGLTRGPLIRAVAETGAAVEEKSPRPDTRCAPSSSRAP